MIKSLVLSAFALGSVWAQSATTTSCSAKFTSVTAAKANQALNPGWNLGNTLDAIPNEGSWNNAPVKEQTFDDIKAAGFKSIRIPVTWTHHIDADVSPWTVNNTWMDRVETVVDQVLARGFYAILNVHHDSWEWADVTVAGANLTLIENKFGSLWSQIGKRFACKSSKLIFEPINEPPGNTQADGDELNKLNDIFLKSINEAGGYNPKRVVSLSGPGMDIAKTTLYWKRGNAYPSQEVLLQVHYYSPYDFVFGAWARTSWGTDADKTALKSDFDLLHGNFSTIPTFIGEWDVSTPQTEPAARWKYFDYFLQTARSYGYSTVLWDNGLDQFNRVTRTWLDPVTLNVLKSAVAGKTDSLADITTDAAQSREDSSAFIFHKVGAAVTDQTAQYILNGNKLSSIKTASGANLKSSTDYSMATNGTLTLKKAYLSTLLTPTAAPGVKANLTVTFSAGATLSLTVVHYDTPTIAAATVAASANDVTVPVAYKGLSRVAAVRAYKKDGTYLADDWTQYLPPLQRAGWTFGNWDSDASGLIIKAQGGSVIQAAGQDVTLVVDFYPRSLTSNSVNVTVTV